MTVLVVDDDKTIRDQVRGVLENYICRVLQAADGLEGLYLSSREQPDLIILDCCMPMMSGAKVLRRLRADPCTDPIPVILMSGTTPEEMHEANLTPKADGYLLKPFRPLDLLEEMQQALRPRAVAIDSHDNAAA